MLQHHMYCSPSSGPMRRCRALSCIVCTWVSCDASSAACLLTFCACDRRITNHCSSVVNFSWRQYATAGEEFDSAAADMSDILKETSMRPMRPDQQGVLDSLSSGAAQTPTQLCISQPVHVLLPAPGFCASHASACLTYYKPFVWYVTLH